ncbi:MAG: recombinase family protein [Methylocella sp.]
MIYGYARVSTDGQSLDAQVKQLRAAGAEKVLRETASGAKTDRVQLRRALDQLAKGDVLMATRLDRLARSTRDLLNTLATITGKGAGFRSLHDTWADTTTAHGRLMLTVLGGLAEFERELIRARTGEGRGSAGTSSDRYADAHVACGGPCAALHVACGGPHAAPHAAASQPSGPQHLTPLGSWAELRGLMRLVLEGKTPFGGRSFPI